MNQALKAIFIILFSMELPGRSLVLARGLVFGLVLLGSVAATLAPAWAASPALPDARLRWGQQTTGPLEAGTPIELRLEVWVSTWFQAPVEFPATLGGNGVMVEQIAGSPDSRFEEFDGRRWTGLIRRYRVLPLQSGPVSVALPAPLAVLAGGSNGRVLSLKPPAPLRLTVRLPAGAEGLVPFVAARRLSLQQRWQPEVTSATTWQVGDLVQRDITLRTDSSSPLLPPPDFGQPVGTRVLVSAPQQETQRIDAAAAPELLRQYRASYQLTQAGVVTLPAFEFAWWDVQQRRQRFTRVDGLTLTVLPAAARQDPFAEPAPAAPTPALGSGRSTASAWVAAALALVLGLVWPWLWRRRGQWPAAAALHAALGLRYGRWRASRHLRHACQQQDPNAAAQALHALEATLPVPQRAHWQQDTALQAARSELARRRFGPEANHRWSGEPLWQSVVSLRRQRRLRQPPPMLPKLHP